MEKQQNFRELFKRSKNKNTYQTVAPSGVTYTLTRPNVTAYMLSGLLPDSLSKIMFIKTNDSDFSEKDLTFQDWVKYRAFLGKLVVEICVIPKIVENPQSDDEVTLSDIPDEDIEFLINEAMKGGVEGEALRNFRSKP